MQQHFNRLNERGASHGDDADRESTARRRRLPGWAGLALCLIPAAVLAACGLSSSEDATSNTDAALTAAPDSASTPATDPTGSSTTPPTTAPTATDPAPTEPAVAPISFAADVEPIIESTCANCHIGSGPGTVEVRFDNAGFAAKASRGISSAVERGEMPPWPASDLSVAFDHDWSLTTEQVATLVAWHEAGSPLDVPDDHPIVPSNPGVRLDDPDALIDSTGSYNGEAGQPDEYRCFVYELPTQDAGGYLTAMDFLPDQETIVHHAVGFIVSGDDRESVEALDAGDDNGGWTCFGFSPAPSAQLIYGWAPGQSATRYDDGSGLRLEQGDFFVMQTHYHFESEALADQSQFAVNVVSDDDDAAADMTALNVHVMLGPAEIPCRSDEVGPLCDRDAALADAIAKYGPPGGLSGVINRVCGTTPEDYAHMTDGVASATCDQQIGSTGELVSVFGHEHELGASFRMTLHPDTPDEVVLLDIPKWDFNWQLIYEPSETIEVEQGDVVRLECSWDRSLRDPDLEPAYVLWSEGTNDEMCFAMATVLPTAP